MIYINNCVRTQDKKPHYWAEKFYLLFIWLFFPIYLAVRRKKRTFVNRNLTITIKQGTWNKQYL